MKRTTELQKTLAKRLSLTCLASLLATNSALAAIASGGAQQPGDYAKFDGNGELFFVAFDSTAKVSYTLDLGLDLNSFFINAQQEIGIQSFFPVSDPRWTDFLGQVNPANLRWAVLGADTTGGTAVGGVRLFQTLRQGDQLSLLGTPATVTTAAIPGTLTNGQFTNAMGSAQWGTFFDAVNVSGTHGVAGTALNYNQNGSSVNADAEPGNGYFGEGKNGVGGTSANLNGNTVFNNANAVGQSSWFYYITRSSSKDLLASVSVDEFDNLGHDGYWGFTKVGDNIDSPYKGQYLLSYTLEASTPKAVTAAGQLRANFLDYAAGFQSRLLVNAALGEFAGYQISSLVVPAASPVPEPATWGLFGLGLLGLALKARRRT